MARNRIIETPRKGVISREMKVPADGKPGTVFIETQGCKLNQADSDVLARRFLEAGYEMASSRDEADIRVINSCTVTHTADKKARQATRAALRSNGASLVALTGCYAERAPEDATKLGDNVLVVSNRDKDTLVQRVIDAGAGFKAPKSPPVAAFPPHQRPRAMVKIQEGCDQVCAYCIVPKVRGRERSIPPHMLLEQVRRVVDEGRREAVLTGTQLGSYGFDLDPGTDLAALVKMLLDHSGVERLRVSSLQPQEITPALLSLWKDPRLCPHFHLPLQSGSDAVLKRMRRRYTSGQYIEGVRMVRDNVDNVSITADVIVGFPGEDETDFSETLDLAEKMELASIHAFPYSTRPGTGAAYLKPKVDEGVKKERMARMLELSRRLERAFKEKAVGSVRPVLWEQVTTSAAGPVLTGLTDNYLRVHAKANGDMVGRITGARLESLEDDRISAVPV